MTTHCGKNGCTRLLFRDRDGGYCFVHGPRYLGDVLPEPPAREHSMKARKYAPPEETDPATMRAEMIAARKRHKGPQPEIYPNRAELRVLPTRARGRIL